MDHKFTAQIKEWLEKPESERDYSVGALYLLKLSGNQILYKNIVAALDRRHDVVEYQLQKYYNFRVAALTRAQVEEMSQKVEAIATEHRLEDSAPHKADAAEIKLGKREDHDLLPDEIKAKFVENLSILQRMRELHLRLRTLSLDDATCPDSERYPFLKELISLDKLLHANWEAYDHYVADPMPEPSRSAKANSCANESKDELAQSLPSAAKNAAKPKRFAVSKSKKK